MDYLEAESLDLSGLDAALLDAYGRALAPATLGAQIDSALADDESNYAFTVIASKDRMLACFLVAKDQEMKPDALRHVDSLREMVERSILYHANRNEATLQ